MNRRTLGGSFRDFAAARNGQHFNWVAPGGRVAYLGLDGDSIRLNVLVYRHTPGFGIAFQPIPARL